jgi:hypothetical protein
VDRTVGGDEVESVEAPVLATLDVDLASYDALFAEVGT